MKNYLKAIWFLNEPILTAYPRKKGKILSYLPDSNKTCLICDNMLSQDSIHTHKIK